MPSTVAPERLMFVDYMKSIGIYLIVYGHLNRTAEEFHFLWTFHVPLFFFISGFLNVRNHRTGDIRKKFQRIMVPYFLIYLILTLYCHLQAFWLTGSFDASIFAKNLLGSLWGNHTDPYFIDAALWFLPSLFTVELLFMLWNTRLWWLLLAAPPLSVYLYVNGYLALFMTFDLSLLGLNYYIAGYLLRRSGVFRVLHKAPVALVAVIAVCSCIAVVRVAETPSVWFQGSSVSAYVLSFAGGMAGCFMVGAIGVLCERMFGEIRSVTYLSQNTLLIMGFQGQMIPWAKYLIDSVVMRPAVTSSLAMVLLIPVLLVVNRFFPQVGGRVLRSAADPHRPADAPDDAVCGTQRHQECLT